MVATYDDESIVFGLNQSICEQLIKCDLVQVKNCPVEKQRFFALIDWRQKYPWSVWRGPSLKSFYDGLISQARAYVSKFESSKSALQIRDSEVSINNVLNEESTMIYFATGIFSNNSITLNCLNNSRVKIDCMLSNRPNEANSYFISLVNFTFYGSEALNNLAFNTTLNMNSMRKRRSVDDSLTNYRFVAFFSSIYTSEML